MPKTYPAEFCDDIVRVAENRETGVTIENIAKAFDVHPMTLQKWMLRADDSAGNKPGQSRAEAAEIRELKKRNRALRAGERSPPAGSDVSVAGESAGKGSTHS